MSKRDSDLGGLLAGIAALITAIVGVFIWLGIQPKDEQQSPLSELPNQSSYPSALPEPVPTQPSSRTPSKDEQQSPLPELEPVPTQPSSQTSSSSESLPSLDKDVISLELAKLNEDYDRNALQAKDVYNGRRANISGFIVTNSISECSVMENGESVAKMTRCIAFSPLPHNIKVLPDLPWNPPHIASR